MTAIGYLSSLSVTLLMECPFVVLAYRGVASPSRSLPVTLAANLATHGLLWSLWSLLPGSYPARLLAAETAIVVVEAACYRLLLGGTTWRAAGVSTAANALSVTAGLALRWFTR
jgi:hypothetical protein